ncbi:hypothetical protein GQ53DRAFT_813713 [Thozetella sp. PMI_491]|nr:hypothetical protein GQ53DRAFT_813713 [Thozetella sp. PMI_491]
MLPLHSFSREIFDTIIEYLVVIIGIWKAVHLRLVSKLFDSSILYAICTRQVVDVHDPATPTLCWRISPELLSNIILGKSHNRPANKDDLLSVVASLNRELDALTLSPAKEAQSSDHWLQELQLRQHQVIAEIAARRYVVRQTYLVGRHLEIYEGASSGVGPQTKLGHILCGIIALGNLPLLESLLDDWSQGRISEPLFFDMEYAYFGRPVALAAMCGLRHIVQYLLSRWAYTRWASKRPSPVATPMLSRCSWRGRKG